MSHSVRCQRRWSSRGSVRNNNMMFSAASDASRCHRVSHLQSMSHFHECEPFTRCHGLVVRHNLHFFKGRRQSRGKSQPDISCTASISPAVSPISSDQSSSTTLPPPSEEEVLSASRLSAVVKLHVTSMCPDWRNPWQTKTASRSTGSGALISKKTRMNSDGKEEIVNVILTAAHVVADCTYLQIQKGQSPDKYSSKTSAGNACTPVAHSYFLKRSFLIY